MKDIVKCYFKHTPKYVPDELIMIAGYIGCIVIGPYNEIEKIIRNLSEEEYYIEYDTVNKLLDYPSYISDSVRIEKGAVIRKDVILEDDVVVLMNASINVGARIGKHTMVDMNVVVGSNAIIGSMVHIGAGSIISGTLEPASTKPVIINDNVFIGAGSVILPGITIGKNSVIGAGSVVTKDIPSDVIAYGNPAKIVRNIDNQVKEKTKINPLLRQEL